MGVLHSAKRSLAAAAIAVFAIGCSKDSTAPDAPFDPAGTSSDLAAVGAALESPALESFNAASPEIGATAGGAAALALKAAPTGFLARADKPAALRYAASLAQAYLKTGPTPSLAMAAGIPADLLGTTFMYDVSLDHYVATDLTGAPGNGVRFLLYAVNPVTGVPIEPLVEVGYADVVTTETTTSGSTNVVVVSEGVTYLDYTAQATLSSSALDLGVSGYVTNGDDRVNFDLDNRLTGSTNQVNLALDYVLTVPTRGGFRIDLESTVTSDLSVNATYNLDLRARGPHGTVDITGTVTNQAGTLQVRVNGDLFATIEVSAGAEPVITGADGQPLSDAETAALRDIFLLFGGGLDFFEGLIPLS